MTEHTPFDESPLDDAQSTDLLYSDTESALRDSVRRLFTEQLPPDVVAGSYDNPPPDVSKVWTTAATDLGLAGLLIPESLGGAGASEREAAVVMEEVGRVVAPVPFFTSAVLATLALLAAGDTRTLPALADGSATAALVVPLSTAPDAPCATVTANADGTLDGGVTSVAGVREATVLVVPTRSADGIALHVVDVAAAGVTVTDVAALDMTRPLSDIRFDSVASARVSGGDATQAMHSALLAGSALLASEQFGVAQWCLDTTLAYVKERRQFGREIGSYQAIKHRLADLWLQVSSAGAAARYAADTLARNDSDAPIAARVAASYCGDAAVKAAEECIQLHGGIGMTWEYPAHLYLKRAKSDQIALGTGYRQRAALAQLVDLPAR